MKNQWKVKTASESDYSRWMDFAGSVVSDFFDIDLPHDDKYRSAVLKNIRRKSALFVEDGSRIIGAMMYSPVRNQIGWIAVHRDYRRLGVGTALVARMFRAIPDREEYFVKTFVPEDSGSGAAHPFYESFGFQPAELDCSEKEHNADHPMQVFRKKKREADG